VRKRPIFITAAAVILVAAGAAWRATAPLSFDPECWATGGPKVRFRMRDALLAEHTAGRLTKRADVDRLLGPDDNRGGDPNSYRAYLMENWDGNPWHLRVRFHEGGNIIEFAARPD
jgi:hypothetical protein